MIRVLAEHGGVSGINYCPAFIKTGAERITADDFADHVLHFFKVGGEDIVGLGTDYDGINHTAKGLESIEKFPLLVDGLKKRGFGLSDIEKMASQNALRVISG